MFRVWSEFGFDPPKGLSALVLYVAASIIIGVVLARLIELPVMRLRDRIVPSRSTPSRSMPSRVDNSKVMVPLCPAIEVYETDRLQEQLAPERQEQVATAFAEHGPVAPPSPQAQQVADES